MKTLYSLLAAWVLANSLFTHAQEAQPSPPSRILQIYREGIRPGKEGEYGHIEMEAAHVCKVTPCPQPYLAIKSVTGLGEAWFINGYDSYADMERIWQLYAANPKLMSYLGRVGERKTELVTYPQNLIAQYREDLSEGAGLAIAHMHYFSITTVRANPGENEDFEEVLRISRRTHNRSEIHSIYQVVSGETNGTFLIFTPLRTLQDFDDAQYLRSQRVASLSEDDSKKLRELSKAAIQVSETRLFVLDPAESYAAKEWSGSDPEFWMPPSSTVK